MQDHRRSFLRSFASRLVEATNLLDSAGSSAASVFESRQDLRRPLGGGHEAHSMADCAKRVLGELGFDGCPVGLVADDEQPSPSGSSVTGRYRASSASVGVLAGRRYTPASGCPRRRSTCAAGAVASTGRVAGYPWAAGLGGGHGTSA
jgi:hypothetical protein